MEIQSALTNMSQARVQEEAAIRVEAMGISSMKAQSAALAKLMESVQVISDPNLGRNINVLA